MSCLWVGSSSAAARSVKKLLAGSSSAEWYCSTFVLMPWNAPSESKSWRLMTRICSPL